MLHIFAKRLVTQNNVSFWALFSGTWSSLQRNKAHHGTWKHVTEQVSGVGYHFLGQCHFLRPDMVTLPYGARSSKLELIKHQLFLWCLKIFFSHESKEAAKTVSFGAVWLNKKSITQPHTLSCFKSSQVGHFWSTHTCVSVSKHWNRYYHYTTTSSV